MLLAEGYLTVVFRVTGDGRMHVASTRWSAAAESASALSVRVVFGTQAPGVTVGAERTTPHPGPERLSAPVEEVVATPPPVRAGRYGLDEHELRELTRIHGAERLRACCAWIDKHPEVVDARAVLVSMLERKK